MLDENPTLRPPSALVPAHELTVEALLGGPACAGRRRMGGRAFARASDVLGSRPDPGLGRRRAGPAGRRSGPRPPLPRGRLARRRFARRRPAPTRRPVGCAALSVLDWPGQLSPRRLLLKRTGTAAPPTSAFSARSPSIAPGSGSDRCRGECLPRRRLPGPAPAG